MENDVIKYFNNCTALSDLQKRQSNRVAIWLYRAGITTMTELCSLYEQPDDIKRLRNIGEKSFGLIVEICNVYKEKKEDTNYVIS